MHVYVLAGFSGTKCGVVSIDFLILRQFKSNKVLIHQIAANYRFLTDI